MLYRSLETYFSQTKNENQSQEDYLHCYHTSVSIVFILTNDIFTWKIAIFVGVFGVFEVKTISSIIHTVQFRDAEFSVMKFCL